MPKTRIYIQDGKYYGSLSGNPIKELNPKRHEIVSPSLDRDRREAFIAARDARLAEEREKLPRGPGARGGKPKLPGIRAEATRLYEGGKAAAVAIGNPYDGPADKNTARMILKLFRHDPTLHAHFLDVVATRRSHYYKYQPQSHSIEMYTHKQAYLGSFQLPAAIRNKKSAEAYPGPGHYLRSRYPGGTTKVWTTPDAPIKQFPVRGGRGVEPRVQEFWHRPPRGADAEAFFRPPVDMYAVE